VNRNYYDKVSGERLKKKRPTKKQKLRNRGVGGIGHRAVVARREAAKAWAAECGKARGKKFAALEPAYDEAQVEAVKEHREMRRKQEEERKEAEHKQKLVTLLTSPYFMFHNHAGVRGLVIDMEQFIKEVSSG
jgi:hypothetical protein